MPWVGALGRDCLGRGDRGVEGWRRIIIGSFGTGRGRGRGRDKAGRIQAAMMCGGDIGGGGAGGGAGLKLLDVVICDRGMQVCRCSSEVWMQ